jgi:hypothetical protein
VGYPSLSRSARPIYHTMGPEAPGPIGPVDHWLIRRVAQLQVHTGPSTVASHEVEIAPRVPSYAGAGMSRCGLTRNRWNERGSSGALVIDTRSALPLRKSNVCL